MLEKQLETDIYRLNFQLDEMKDKILTINEFKQAVIKFKLNYETMSESELKGWLKQNIKQIVIDEEVINISFKKLDF